MDADLHELSLKDTNKSEIYNQWAKSYNNYVSTLDYKGPKQLIKLLVEYLISQDIKYNTILDFGCGTGLVGIEIYNEPDINNYTLIGIDISTKMIEKSNETSTYNHLIIDDICKYDNINVIKSKLNWNGFDVIVSCGVFLEGHVSLNVIYEKLVHLINPGGLLAITIRNSYLESNPEFIDKLKSIKFISFVELKEISYLRNVKAWCLIAKIN